MNMKTIFFILLIENTQLVNKLCYLTSNRMGWLMLHYTVIVDIIQTSTLSVTYHILFKYNINQNLKQKYVFRPNAHQKSKTALNSVSQPNTVFLKIEHRK